MLPLVSLEIRGLAEHILADSGTTAEFRRHGQFRRRGPADPNSGVGNSSAEFRRQGQFRRQGPADPNSGVKNSSDEFRRQQLRFARSPYLFAF